MLISRQVYLQLDRFTHSYTGLLTGRLAYLLVDTCDVQVDSVAYKQTNVANWSQ